MTPVGRDRRRILDPLSTEVDRSRIAPKRRSLLDLHSGGDIGLDARISKSGQFPTWRVLATPGVIQIANNDHR